MKLLGKLVKRIKQLGQDHNISVTDYLGDLDTYYEPDVYDNMSNEDLLRDIKAYNDVAVELQYSTE